MAGHLGKSVRELQQEIDLREFNTWRVLAALEPWGDLRQDLQAAIMPTVFTAAFAGKGRKPELTDFVMDFSKKRQPRQTPQEMAAIFKQFAAAHNAALRKNRGG